jgi:hypothetical protein
MNTPKLLKWAEQQVRLHPLAQEHHECLPGVPLSELKAFLSAQAEQVPLSSLRHAIDGYGHAQTAVRALHTVSVAIDAARNPPWFDDLEKALGQPLAHWNDAIRTVAALRETAIKLSVELTEAQRTIKSAKAAATFGDARDVSAALDNAT